MIRFTRIGVIVPDSTPDPTTPEGYHALFEHFRANIIALPVLGRYIHRWAPSASPQNMYRAEEWLAAQNELTNHQIFTYFAGIIAISCGIITLLKFAMRTSQPWRVSPLAAAALLMHLVGDVSFDLIKRRLDYNTPWSTLVLAPDLLSPFHMPKRFSGPAAYTLLALGIWEIIGFGISRIIDFVSRSKSATYGDWLMFMLTIAFATISIDLNINLPMVMERSDGILLREKYVSMDSFQYTVFISTIFTMGCTIMASTAIRAALLTGEQMLLLLGHLIDITESTVIRLVAKYKASRIASLPIVEEIELVKAQEPTSEPAPVMWNPNTTANVASQSATFTALSIESFFWRQLCMVRGQLQELQDDSFNMGDDHSKYSHAIITLLPVHGLLTKVVELMQSGGVSMDRFEVHLKHVHSSLKRMKLWMADLVGAPEASAVFKSEPDNAFICSLEEEEKQFWCSLREELFELESSLEGQNDLNRLALRLDDYTFLFFPQLHHTTAAMELLLEKRVNQHLEAACPALDVHREIAVKTEHIEIKKEDVLQRFQSVTEYEFQPIEALSTTEEVTPTATPAEEAGHREPRSVDSIAASFLIPATSSSRYLNGNPLLVFDVLNAAIESDSETVDLQADAEKEELEKRNMITVTTSDDSVESAPCSAVDDAVATADIPRIKDVVVQVEEETVPVTVPTTNASPIESEQPEPSWVIEDATENNTASSDTAGSHIESPDASNASGDETTLCIPVEEPAPTSNDETTPIPIAEEHDNSNKQPTDDSKDHKKTEKVEATEISIDSGDKSDSATCSTVEVVAPAVIIDAPPIDQSLPSVSSEAAVVEPSTVVDAAKGEQPVAEPSGTETNGKKRKDSDVDSQHSTLACELEKKKALEAKKQAEEKAAAEALSAPPRGGKGPDEKVTPLWTGVVDFDFKKVDILRDPKKAKQESIKAEDILSFVQLGEYLHCDVRGNRAEMQSAAKVVKCLGQYADDAAKKKNPFNIGNHSLNYLRASIWLGQAYLTRFTITSPTHEFTEVPLEGLIKLAGFGAGAFKTGNMLPHPKETWREYLERLPVAPEEPAEDAVEKPEKVENLDKLDPAERARIEKEKAEKAFLNKAGTMRGLLSRYLGQSTQMMDREVPRAEGWNENSSIDSTLCLKHVMENLMLLPPYGAAIDRTLVAWLPKRERTKKEAVEREAEQESKKKEAAENGVAEEKTGKKRSKKKKATNNNPAENEVREELATQEA